MAALIAPLASALGGLRVEPAAWARKFFQATVVLGTVAMVAGFVMGKYHKENPPPCFPLDAEGLFGTGATTGDAAPSSASGSEADLAAAIETAGVPKEWINDPDLLNIMMAESSSTPDNLNCIANTEGSGAFGPLQVMPDTKTAMGISGDSCQDYLVAGLIYIKTVYTTPTQAWKYWQAHHSY